jgi:glycosyltransferase involved in cell wall biosynthesis
LSAGAAPAPERRPRLLALVQLPPPVHGVTLVNRQVLDVLAAEGRHQLDCLPLRFSRSIDDIDRVHAGKLVRALGLAARLLARCLRRRPDLVYFSLTPTGPSFYRDLLYIAVLRALAVPRLLHLHGLGVRAAGRRFLPRLLYGFAFGGARVVHLAEGLYEDVAGHVPPAACRFLNNGIPDPCPRPPRRSGAGPCHFLFLSHMVPPKGPLLLLEALARLRRGGVAFRATFAGGRFSAVCREEFTRIVAERRLGDAVGYAGEVHGEAKRRLLEEADVLVLPSLYDTFPLVLIEAMAFHLPVVSTRQGGIPDIVEDGRTGLLAERGDVAGLAARLRLLAEAPELRRRLGAAGRERYLARFTEESFRTGLLRILEEVLSTSR